MKALGGLAADRINLSIEVPSYVQDVAKVQIWCAWAEAVLGEATFSAPQLTMPLAPLHPVRRPLPAVAPDPVSLPPRSAFQAFKVHVLR